MAVATSPLWPRPWPPRATASGRWRSTRPACCRSRARGCSCWPRARRRPPRWWATAPSTAAPPARNLDLAAVLEPDADVAWHSAERTARWLELMAPLHRARLAARAARDERAVGAVFRRMRIEDGRRVQRAEARFDGLAGCLR